MDIEALYNEYGRMVFNVALQYVQNREDAEEITQDTFVAIYRSIKNFEERSALSTWIYRIAINQSLDFIKARKRKKRFALFTHVFSGEKQEMRELFSFDHPGVQLEQKEEMKILFGLINSLPANQKTALILNKIEGRSQREIAEIMKISPKAVESLIQRARATLAKKIKPGEGLEKIRRQNT